MNRIILSLGSFNLHFQYSIFISFNILFFQSNQINNKMKQVEDLNNKIVQLNELHDAQVQLVLINHVLK